MTREPAADKETQAASQTTNLNVAVNEYIQNFAHRWLHFRQKY